MGTNTLINTSTGGVVTSPTTFNDTITLEPTIDIAAPTGEDIQVKLGDAAGSNKFALLDSGSVEVAKIDSDGNLQIDGTASLDGAGSSITCTNTGLHILDTNASHDLIIAPGSDLTADHTLTVTTGDADRILTLSGNLTVESASLVNQDLTTDASPQFAGANFTGAVTGIALDEIENLAASKTFTMADKDLIFNYTTPSTGFELNATGAFTDHLMHLHQLTGNPGAGTQMLHIEAEDPDVIDLELEHSGDNASFTAIQYQLNRATPTDNDNILNSWYFDHDGSATSQGAREFIRETVIALDVTEDSEDSAIFWSTMVNGSLTETLRLTQGNVELSGTLSGVTALSCTSITTTGRILGNQGSDVASANDLTLGSDGNVFEITGTTQINRITNTSWQNGSIVHLLFTATPTVKHGQASGSPEITILLAGSADFNATAGDTLTLMLCEIGGTQAWREIARTAI